jgi:hypothetical protein
LVTDANGVPVTLGERNTDTLDTMLVAWSSKDPVSGHSLTWASCTENGTDANDTAYYTCEETRYDGGHQIDQVVAFSNGTITQTITH